MNLVFRILFHCIICAVKLWVVLSGCYFQFFIIYRSPALFGNHYSECQLLFFSTISEERKKGKTFDQIEEWLNRKGYLSVRGKKFRGTYIHSILKKRLKKEELLNSEHPPVWSSFKMELVDETILLNGFRFKN